MKSDNTISLMARIHEKINKRLINALKEDGINDLAPSHADILAALFKKDRVTMAAVAKLIHRDKSTVTQLIKKLSQKGYVTIRPNPLDRRSNLVCLTNRGKTLEAIFQKISEQLYQIVYAHLRPDEIGQFKRLIRMIDHNL
ncbi:MAG: MarR family transcriptional regulator [Sporolactobacillus sp.]|jgi:DNA-binding MarR family transcriptional regulator|nr:MarR family transcriptional regulator [Sporolactobacillus sp.]